MKSLLTKSLLVLGLVAITASESHAEFRRICRGANLPAYRKEIKNAVKAKLNAANIPFRSVAVNFTNIRRTQDTYSPDFSTGMTLGDGSTPTVTFAGTFPAVTACDVTGKLKIRVQYASGATITRTDFTAPGSMLFKSAFNAEGGLGAAPNAD